MRQLTESERDCSFENYMAQYDRLPHTYNGRAIFDAGFTAGLEYQDKRIEALEAKIHELEQSLADTIEATNYV